jgi:hypothetical protein
MLLCQEKPIMPNDRDRTDSILEEIDRANAAKEAAAAKVQNDYATFLAAFHTLKATAIIPAFQYFARKSSASVSFQIREDDEHAALTIVNAGKPATIITLRASMSRQQIGWNIADAGRQTAKSEETFLSPSVVTEAWVQMVVENALEKLAGR